MDGDLPIIAFDGAAGEVHVLRFDGVDWVGLAGSEGAGGISNSATISRYPDIAIWQGVPVVTWEEHFGNSAEVYLRRFAGGVWAELDGSGTGGGLSNTFGPSTSPHVAVGGDTICAAWNEITESSYDVFVRCAPW
jgi:hypothetical protein